MKLGIRTLVTDTLVKQVVSSSWSIEKICHEKVAASMGIIDVSTHRMTSKSMTI